MLVDIFIEVEDKNFALFNYVNELNNEIELLQEIIAGIEDDVDKFKKESVELEQQRKDILSKLEVILIFYFLFVVIALEYSKNPNIRTYVFQL